MDAAENNANICTSACVLPTLVLELWVEPFHITYIASTSLRFDTVSKSMMSLLMGETGVYAPLSTPGRRDPSWVPELGLSTRCLDS